MVSILAALLCLNMSTKISANEKEWGAPPVEEEPLVTFALFAYNQEQYIREAIEGAFTQNYSTLEIILSDDCSSDGTYGIMRKMAEEYKGPHKVRLNKNKRNLGLAEHINTVADLAEGNLLVMAAGDDISFPERVVELVRAWRVMGSNVLYVGSSYTRMDVEGAVIGVGGEKRPKISRSAIQYLQMNPVFWGCSAAYDIQLFKRFPKLNSNLVHEDRVLPFRGILLGGEMAYVNQPLLSYREGGVSFEKRNKLKDPLGRIYIQTLKRFIGDYEQKLTDLSQYAGDDKDLLSRECSFQIELFKLRGVSLQRPYSFLELIRMSRTSVRLRKHAKRLILRNLFPYFNLLRQKVMKR